MAQDYNSVQPGEMDPEEAARRRREQEQQNSQTPPPPPAGSPAATPSYSGPLPTGYSQGEVNEWLARNPGDQGRVMSALNDRSTGYVASHGGSAPSNTPTTPAQPDWYQSYFKDYLTRQADQETERKAKADQLYNTWLGRAQQSTNIDRNDPTIRAQADAYSANQQRSQRNYLSDLAEKMGPLANLRGEQRMAAEHTGQATGGFEAELMARELTARRDQIAQALQGMAGQLSQDQQVNAQRELATLDQAIKQQGLGLQSRGLDIDWQRALLQNNQFMSDLGLRAENQYNYWNDPLRTKA